jgi:hypothetical protein
MNKYVFLILAIVTSISTSSMAQSEEVIKVEGQGYNCYIPFEDKAHLALLDLFSNAEKGCTKGHPEQSPEIVLTQVSSCVVVAKAKFTCKVY